jgi:hypothetical protein
VTAIPIEAEPQPILGNLDPGESIAEGRLALPGGVIDGTGRCCRTVRVRELTGRDEEILADRRYTNPAVQVTDLLTRVVSGIDGLEGPVTPGLIAGMLIGDRDYLVLRLRQMTLGDAVHQVVRCPNLVCGRKADIEFSLSELPVRRLQEPRTSYEVVLPRPAMPDDPTSFRCALRLPTGDDHEAVARLEGGNSAVANTALLSRLLVRIGSRQGASEEHVRDFPLQVRGALLGFIERQAPGPDLRISVPCPHCGEDLTYPFDLASFFFSEWTVSADRLFEEIHFLAFHYHWSEREILQLTRERRRRYLGLLARRSEEPA